MDHFRQGRPALARERGLVATALAADDPASADLLADFHAAREVAKTALDETLLSLAKSASGSGPKNRLQKVQLLRDRVIDLRQEADISIRHPVSGRNAGLRATWTIASTALIEICQDIRLAAMRSTRAADRPSKIYRCFSASVVRRDPWGQKTIARKIIALGEARQGPNREQELK